MSDTYPHMCRMDHEEIGYRGDDERCPVCKRIDENKRLQSVLDAARISLDRWWLHREDLPAAMLDLANAFRALDGEVKP